MGCVMWSIECICSESFEEVSYQRANYCEKNGFDNPGIAKFMRDPGFFGANSKSSGVSVIVGLQMDKWASRYAR